LTTFTDIDNKCHYVSAFSHTAMDLSLNIIINIYAL
jgi:hypothetical protein